MKFVVDMNLSPDWVDWLASAGWESVHWHEVGEPDANDEVIFSWARKNGFTVLTSDLDFGALLAVTSARLPSIVQFRGMNLLTAEMRDHVFKTLATYAGEIEQGALVVVNPRSSRIRILPLT